MEKSLSYVTLRLKGGKEWEKKWIYFLTSTIKEIEEKCSQQFPEYNIVEIKTDYITVII